MKEFTNPLRLVSPPMHGQKVKDAQYLMAGHSRFPDLATYKDGKIDGIYGTLTAQATKRAKYWTGYPIAACDTNFGQTLYEYLRPNDWRPLPTDYRLRRNDRIQAAQQTAGQKALEYGMQFVGVKESPFGSNCQEFGAWYRMNCVAWCAIFVSYNFGHTGTPSFRYSYVPAIWQSAIYNQNRLHVVRTPAPGDLALYDFGTELAHVGFVKTAVAGGHFTDLSGNTGLSNQANGGEVMVSDRYTSTVHGFVRVAA